MKVKISRGELWPWFIIDDYYGTEVDVTPEQVERWEKASGEFFACQDEMRDLFIDKLS